MRVHVMGPNLRGTEHPYHVHAEGCADIERSPLYRGNEHKSDRANAIEVESLADVAEYLFCDVEEFPRECTGDIKVFGCAAELPAGE